MSSPLKLFDSEDEEENYEDFQIRPQYQGPHGEQMLEINSQLSKRFKLDEQFAEEFEPIVEEVDECNFEENEEKKKNIKILETILGHEVRTKSLDKSSTKKKQIRYDPDDENALKLIKAPDTVSKKQKKSKNRKKKEMMINKIEETLPVSTERYIEVCPNLKEILNTSTPFSFSQKFSHDAESLEDFSQTEVSSKIQDLDNKNRTKVGARMQNQCTVNFIPKSKCEIFFIAEDPRLKEGIEFFKRTKNIEDIRALWQKRRENVLELFRRRKRSSQKSHSTRVQSMQIKNNIRRNKF